MSTRLDLLSKKNQDTFALNQYQGNKDVFEFEEESSDVIQKDDP